MGNDSTLAHSTVESRAITRRKSKGYAEIRPETLDFGFISKGSNATLQVYIVNNRAKPMSWKADTGGASWLMIDGECSGQIQPHGQQIIDVKTNTASLDTAETYLTILNFILLDSVKIHIPATVEFIGPKEVAQNHISPKSPIVNPGTQPASSTASQSSFSITVDRGSTGYIKATISNPPQNITQVSWNATSSESWLTLSPSFSGKLQPNSSQPIEMIVDATSIAPGNYQPTLSFTATDTSSVKSKTPTVVTVQVTVK